MIDDNLGFDENNPNELLEECLLYLNMIPRKKIGSENTRDSYELASLIDKYLKNKDWT